MELYPVQLETNNPGREGVGRIFRASTRKFWKDEAKFTAAKISFSRDITKIWKNAP